MSTSTLSEEFDDELDNFQNQIYDLQNQINQLKEQVSNTLSPSTTAQPNTYITTHRGSTPEEKTIPHRMPATHRTAKASGATTTATCGYAM